MKIKEVQPLMVSKVEEMLCCIFATLFFVMLSFSCKKELSCESCREANKPPIAIAGPDQNITLPTDGISLDGSPSNDPDGTINTWLWKKISGPSAFSIINPSTAKTVVRNIVAGIYRFELTVTDNQDLSAKDTVTVIVDSIRTTNHPPVANAGADQIITLPATTATIDGSGSTDPDNNIAAYLWTKISGPSSSNIATANAAQTSVSNLVEGFYEFELLVTDASGLSDKDTVTITVTKRYPPCADCKIVFVSDRDGNAEIYSCDADGSNIKRLTNSAGDDDDPAWSPDGKKIAFMSARTGVPEIYTMNADGSNVTRRTFTESYSGHPTWSPDGAKIAYSSNTNGSANIWVVGATTGSPSLLLERQGRNVQPAWSPDGTKIAFASDWAAFDFVFDIYTIKPDGTGLVNVSDINIFDQINYLGPSWSPDGSKLAMEMRQPSGTDPKDIQIGVMNADGTGIRAIASDIKAWTATSWSGDGTSVAYTSVSGLRKDVAWASAKGTSKGIIVTNAWNPNWQH
ncbi:TolB family protein [Pinibacter soli]|uniref:PKD domain-containing protein n=1 Tax=Pinibacter soli TaxID=3044211 RepID=A0ABT6REH6_9BACT|nr:PKD domain-containing protein [Pinibacter soli]MDI3320981.1 PKD domain-containing protein [Pinibacter soli]